MNLRIGCMGDLESITDLAYRKNNEEKHQIAYCCKSRESIYKDYEAMIKGEENLVVTAWYGGKLYGILGLFCNDEIKRVDCAGPFVDCKDTVTTEGNEISFVEAAGEMLKFAKQHYPNYEFSFYFNSKNIACKELMKKENAENMGNEQFLCLKHENFNSIEGLAKVISLPKGYEEQLRMLHDEIFPGCYLTGNQLLKSLGKEREAYVILEGNQLAAFGILEIPTNANDRMNTEIIGVKEDHRGKGFGKAIVNELLYQAFCRDSIKQVNLVVDEVNILARNLYASFGFECIQENCNYSLR